MKRSAVLVGVSALTMTLAVNAAEWFNADIGNYTAWPVTTELTGGAWDATTTGGAMLTGTAPAAKLELDTEAPLTFEATDARALGDDTEAVVVNSSIQFNPFNSDAMPDVPTDAKAGLIVVKDGDSFSYYGLSNEGAENEWVQLVGATPDPAAEVAVVITVKNTEDGKLANYTVDGVTLTLIDETTSDIPVVAEDVSSVSYAGCGVVSALDAAFDAPDYSFTVTSPANAAIDSVMVGGEVLEAPYKADLGAEVTVTWKASDGFLFADGQATASQTFTVGKDNEQKFEPTEVSDAQKAKAAIGTQLFLTINDAFKGAADGDTITLTGDVTDLSFEQIAANTFPNGVTLDLDGNTWTALGGGTAESDTLFSIYAGNKLTVKNGSIKVDETATALKYAYYAYAEELVFEDVALDLTNIQKDNEASDARRMCAFVVQNGSLTFTGDTTIQLAEGWKLVTEVDRAGAQYAMGTVTIDLAGEVAGDIYLLGDGKLALGEETVLTGNVYAGAASFSVFSDECVEGCGFVARNGELSDEALGGSGLSEVTAQLFRNMNVAVNAMATTSFGDVLLLIDDVEAAAVYEGAADFTLDLNEKTWTKDGSEWAALKVFGEEPATVTITGEGAMIGGAGFCVWAKTGTVIIENGSFENDSNDNYAIYANNTGKVEINGGTFTNENTDPYIYNPELKSLNLNVANDDPNCSITVFGGTFTAEPKDDSGIDFVAPGYVATEADGEWTVVEQTMPMADVAENAEAAAEGKLDAAFTFTAKGICPAAVADKNVDFVVTFDKDIAKDKIRLAAKVGGEWLNFPFAEDIVANEPYSLLAIMGAELSVAKMYAMGTFVCGVANLDAANTGAGMSVKLVMDDETPYVLASQDYTLVEPAAMPQVAPGGSPVQVEAADETEAISKVELIATSPDADVVSDGEYKKYFQVKAADLGGGKWNVFAELKDDIVKAAPETTGLAAALKSIAAGATEVALTGAKPGLYYSVRYTNNVGNMSTADEGDRTPADKSGAVTISTPVIPESAAMFYQIQVNTKPKDVLE